MPRCLKVEVDFFGPKLPPAHFFVWTKPVAAMDPADWQKLVGTSAEWALLSQGRRMLTVKGLHGGDEAMPSSFALSAAAFGQVPLPLRPPPPHARPSLAPPARFTALCSRGALLARCLVGLGRRGPLASRAGRRSGVPAREQARQG